ncbi:hypothetical protein [Roseivirga pacifica]|uniref:hypothetical protein n=1 Tax=Roseivirga pacifica TaxID=1267423 RepID=UPI003BB04AAC
MLVESMSDMEFVLEVVRDFNDEMMHYVKRAVEKKGRIKRRQASSYKSKKGNHWLIIYRPQYEGQVGLYIKRPQTNNRYTWYALMPSYNGITLFGFNKHVAQRISERFSTDMTPFEALKDMFIRTPAINQIEFDSQFYTRVNGGVCIGPVMGKRINIDMKFKELPVELRTTKTFISDDLLFDDQEEVTHEAIVRGLERLGREYLTDQDRDAF